MKIFSWSGLAKLILQLHSLILSAHTCTIGIKSGVIVCTHVTTQCDNSLSKFCVSCLVFKIHILCTGHDQPFAFAMWAQIGAWRSAARLASETQGSHVLCLKKHTKTICRCSSLCDNVSRMPRELKHL